MTGQVSSQVSSRGRFAWYELMTTDVAAATAFYTEVMRWDARDASAPGSPYTLLGLGDRALGGLTILPHDAREAGATPRWVGYVGVDDVAATAAMVAHLGGVVHVPPMEVADVSHVAIVADPQMAMFGLITWLGDDPTHADAADAPVAAGWHELLAADATTAFAFYGALLGWGKAETGVDRGGTYQLFSTGGQTIGGMFTKPPMVPVPFWLYYFSVGDVDAAAARATAAGGEILEGPLDVIGGAGVVRCMDPQGAMFALVGQRAKKPVGYFAPKGSRTPSAARDRRRWSQPHRRSSFGAAERKLADRALDVKRDAGHPGEQVDIGAADRAAAQSHVGRHQVEGLQQHAGILEDQRIGDRAVFPRHAAEARRDRDQHLRGGGRSHRRGGADEQRIEPRRFDVDRHQRMGGRVVVIETVRQPFATVDRQIELELVARAG